MKWGFPKGRFDPVFGMGGIADLAHRSDALGLQSHQAPSPDAPTRGQPLYRGVSPIQHHLSTATPCRAAPWAAMEA